MEGQEMIMEDSRLFCTARRVLPPSFRRVLWAGWSCSRRLLAQIRLQPRRLRAIRAARVAARRSRMPRQVVFVSDRPGPREAKLAYGLEQNGWQVVLLCREAPNFHAKRYCVEIKRYQSPWEALSLAAGYRPLVYHAFSNWNFEVAATLIRYKPGKIVFDNYDVMAGMVKEDFLKKHYPGQLELERVCIEQADGLCCRSLELQYAQKHFDYQLKGKVIFFPDYCWDFDILPRSSKTPRSKGIHVVYGGNLEIEKQNPHHRGYGDFLWLAKLLAKQKVHFHLYPSQWKGDFEEAFSDYLDLDRSSPYFHLHRSVMADDLIGELRQYSLGLQIMGSKIHGTIDHPVYLPPKPHYAMTNKVFDYLDAGLPLVMHNGRLLLRLFKKYGVVLIASREIFDNAQSTLVSFPSPAVKKRVRQARRAYSVVRHASKLIKFYESL